MKYEQDRYCPDTSSAKPWAELLTELNNLLFPRGIFRDHNGVIDSLWPPWATTDYLSCPDRIGSVLLLSLKQISSLLTNTQISVKSMWKYACIVFFQLIYNISHPFSLCLWVYAILISVHRTPSGGMSLSMHRTHSVSWCHWPLTPEACPAVVNRPWTHYCRLDIWLWQED